MTEDVYSNTGRCLQQCSIVVVVVEEYLYGAAETESHYAPGSHLNGFLAAAEM